MHGVIISTGQWPRTGWKRTVPPVLRRGPLAWADVAGVEYPAEAYAEGAAPLHLPVVPPPAPAKREEAPVQAAPAPAVKPAKPARRKRKRCHAKLDPALWVGTAEAAAALGLSASAARAALNKGRATARLTAGGLMWKRAEVEAMVDGRTPGRVDAVPEGWVTTTEACEALGVSRSSLQRYAESGRVPSRKVYLKGALGYREKMIFPAAGLAALNQKQD